MKKLLKIFWVFMIVMSVAFLGCKHHHDDDNNHPPISENPASYNYVATEVGHHQPGFFSCYWLNGLNMGTYMDYNHKHDMQAQFCRFENGRVVVKRVVHGAESIYNLRKIDDNSLFAPGEQSHLFGMKLDGSYWIIHPKHLRMGHYQAQWWNHDGIAEWVTTEKDTISTQNKSQIWINGKLLYETSDFTWKEFVIKGNDCYLATYFIWKHTEGGVLKVNLKTGEPDLLYSERWTSCYCIGLNKKTEKVWYALEHGNSSTLCKLPHDVVQDIPAKAWRFRFIKKPDHSDGTFFLTASKNGWRHGGPSYVYVYNTETGVFDLKITIPEGASEPWDICGSDDPNVFYLVTRDESKGNLGKIFKITRSK